MHSMATVVTLTFGDGKSERHSLPLSLSTHRLYQVREIAVDIGWGPWIPHFMKVLAYTRAQALTIRCQSNISTLGGVEVALLQMSQLKKIRGVFAADLTIERREEYVQQEDVSWRDELILDKFTVEAPLSSWRPGGNWEVFYHISRISRLSADIYLKMRDHDQSMDFVPNMFGEVVKSGRLRSLSVTEPIGQFNRSHVNLYLSLHKFLGSESLRHLALTFSNGSVLDPLIRVAQSLPDLLLIDVEIVRDAFLHDGDVMDWVRGPPNAQQREVLESLEGILAPRRVKEWSLKSHRLFCYTDRELVHNFLRAQLLQRGPGAKIPTMALLPLEMVEAILAHALTWRL